MSNPITCPFCLIENTDSIVHVKNMVSIGEMDVKYFYDEKGAHVHNKVIICTHYNCSLGHNFNIKNNPKCPNNKCDFGK